uniref:Cysteine-rich transmembrane domain-containing protein n=1 Tax=Lotus japonicus TaxID=34305 RepID=I3SKD8_LOTJA|nr:unknown [Lotus japonicus]
MHVLCGELLFSGYYQGPPVVAPPQYAPQYAAPSAPRKGSGFLEGCFAAMCCCCLVDECCCDPSIICMF